MLLFTVNFLCKLLYSWPPWMYLAHNGLIPPRQLCFQRLSVIHRHYVKHYNYSTEKNLIAAKEFKNTIAEFGCFWSWCWISGPPFVCCLPCNEVKRRPYDHCFFHSESFSFYGYHPWFCIVLCCHGANCGQILSPAASSQISGTGSKLVTYKRVVSVVMSIWAISAFFSILDQFYGEIMYFVKGTLLPVLFILSAFFYCKIFLAVRRHRNQIHDLRLQQQEQNVEETATAPQSWENRWLVRFTFILCFLPVIHRICWSILSVL